MKLLRIAPAIPVLLAALFLMPDASDFSLIKRAMPQPIEHRLDDGAEKRNKKARKDQFKRMHRSAPDVDWKALEHQNGLAAMARKMERIRGGATAAGNGSWRELGSRNQAGRIHCAAWSPDGQTLYAGSDRGGLWRGERDGTEWTPLGDNLYGGVHEMAVLPGASPSDPDILIALYGKKVHRSIDQGLTWIVPDGLTQINGTKRILVLDDAVHTVMILIKSSSSAWKIKTSSDLGATFTLRYTLATEGDIWTTRDQLGPVFAVDGSKIIQSNDAGRTWNSVGVPIPVTCSRAVLAGSEVPEIRFNVAMNVNNTWELWRSTDTGMTWSYLRDLDDFWESLVASTISPYIFAYAGVEMFVTHNGGSNWTKVNNWGDYYGDPLNKLHADVPGLRVLPDPNAPSGEVWYIGTDGGLYHSEALMSQVLNLSMNGLGVSQYYTVHTSRRNPDLVLAGSQDQGYQRAELNGPPPPPPGPWADFDQLISGDYGHLTSSDGSHDLIYSVYPGFVLVQEGEENPSLLYPWVDFPSGESHLWMPFILADPLDKESFYFCATRLYRYTRESGANYSYVQHSSQDFSPGYLTALAFSPLNPQRAWAVTGNGRLYYSTDGAVTWTQSLNTGPGSHYFYGTVLLPSSTDENTCWVAGSGYYSTAPVSKTTDGGVSWAPERDGLPGTLVYCMAEAPDGSGKMFCGSENGAWVYDPNTRLWSDLLGTDAPICTYWTCETVPSQNLIRFGTYGRGIWDYSLETAGYFPYGELLDPPHVLTLDNEAPPLIGNPTTFTINGCQAAAGGVLALSTQPASWPLYGGTLLVQLPAILLSFQANGAGEATLTFSLPNSQSIVGKQYYFQAATVDATQPQGYAFSNGLRAVVGE